MTVKAARRTILEARTMLQFMVIMAILAIWALTSLLSREAQPLPPRARALAAPMRCARRHRREWIAPGLRVISARTSRRCRRSSDGSRPASRPPASGAGWSRPMTAS